ncbi:hypothetical protein HAX54_035502 [Datura stramonium]|uniref:TF-B3 domain-containing protein n=1 Tax=Datura stramonium TaxID=4076 RepID=A0ABS8VG89_DATST|nr:hypothetical protein [Datura stramonium]
MKLQAIPQKFAKNLRAKLKDYISLKGPSGTTWSVGLTGNENSLFLKHGWKEFVDAHSLVEGDLLIFKYNGNSQFDVLVFDRQSSCEKETAYFVKKCEHAKCEHADVASGSRTKRPTPERNDTTSKSSSSEQASESSSHEEFEGSATKKPKLASTPTSSARVNANLRCKKIKSTSSRLCGDPLKLTSDRQKAFELATAAATPNSFLVVMRGSHVSPKFYMSVPSEWARKHLPPTNLDVTLRVRENTWQVDFIHTPHGGALTGRGWRNFVLDNFLEKFEVCVFNLVSGEDSAKILDVIPPKFVNNLRAKLEEFVSRKGSSGAIWIVGLTTNRDTLFLKHGWKEFVDAHSLVDIQFRKLSYPNVSLLKCIEYDDCSQVAFGFSPSIKPSMSTFNFSIFVDNGNIEAMHLIVPLDIC